MGESELVGCATVLESPEHGPQLCFSILESSPPQGNGPDVVNWDWSLVSGCTSEDGTTWGEYTLVGTFDGVRFTMTRPPRSGRRPDTRPVDDLGPGPFSTPCPEPDGGWRVVAPSRTTEESLSQTFEEARRLPGYAGGWVDHIVRPAGHDDGRAQRQMNDPWDLIVNVAVTGDTATAALTLRQIWGGALCVRRARHSEAELLAVQREVAQTSGMISAGVGRDQVGLEVVHDDGSLQRALDGRYGEGVVVVTSALKPYTF